MLMATAAFASGTEYRPTTPPAAPASKTSKAADWFAKGKAALEAKDFAKAEKCFAEANRIEANKPETLNELAISQRKQGKLDESFANYGKALKLQPKFPEAREYLGEAHLQAVMREIETLKSYGPDGKEELEDLAKALKDAAASVKP
jgi:Flp pilus assembly protein TadD